MKVTRNRIASGALASFLFAASGLHAAVTLPDVLSDHMVLQREKPVHLWGVADPGESVTATFRGHRSTATADALGRWSLYLPPGPAGGPFSLVIEGKNTITWNDVLVGDLWLASGQSNMEFPMKETPPWTVAIPEMEKELASATHADIRLLRVDKQASDYPRSDASVVPWTACTPESVSAFSAVAYFFGRELEQKEHVPIGLIESTWGGTPAEAWTSLDALSADASLMPVFHARALMADEHPTTLLQVKAEKAAAEKAAAEGKTISLPWRPDFAAWAPGALFNAMIAPLVPLPIRGVIWYQGESNADPERASLYERLFPILIEDWRARWGEGDFPFLFVQIANYGPGEEWPLIREAQRRALTLANTGMAVTIDIGDAGNIHPADKQDVGHRLALLAQKISYGESIEDAGPLFRQAVPEGGAMRIWFDHAENGLIVRGGRLTGFEVAGADGRFVPAGARVDNGSVLASSPSVPQPRFVRYGWAANPRCNLYNRDGLPASPFTSMLHAATTHP
jgi:sialate O-acetylesterase